MSLPTVFFAIPAMDELDYLPQTLACIARQDYPGRMEVHVCVNQPQSDYCKSPLPTRVTNNQKLWQLLEENPWRLSLHPIDRFSPDKAWKGKEGGVGLARQCCVNALLPQAAGSDLLISMDADTLFDADYVSQMVEYLEKHRKTVVVLPQFHHRLSGDERQDPPRTCHCMFFFHVCSPVFNYLPLSSGSSSMVTSSTSSEPCES